MTNPVLPTPAEAWAIAQAVVASRYPSALYAFAAGSILRGEGTAYSDIDLIVVVGRVERAWREALLVDGVPVEIFVQDEETLAHGIQTGTARGRPSFVALISEARVLGRARERGEQVQRAVAAMFSGGPPPMPPAQIAAMRFAITEATDDLRGERSHAEYLSIGIMLYPMLAELALRGRGAWNATAKWVPRTLEQAESGLAERFDHAFRALFASGEPEAVIALVERELTPHGGFLFEGHRQSSPPGRASLEALIEGASVR